MAKFAGFSSGHLSKRLTEKKGKGFEMKQLFFEHEATKDRVKVVLSSGPIEVFYQKAGKTEDWKPVILKTIKTGKPKRPAIQ